MTEQRTVRVRIAVAVDSSGKWGSCGWMGADEEDAMCHACEALDALGEALYWLEAELPLPTASTIAAKVIDASDAEAG